MEINKELVNKLLVPKNYKNHWVYDLDELTYHNDKTAVNSSSLKWMLSSPSAFYRAFFLQHKKKENNSMKYGKLCHMAILEGKLFKERHMVVPDFGDMRSKNNRAMRDTWMAEILQSMPTAVFVTEEELEKIMSSVDALLSHREASKLLSNGVAEVTGYYRCPITGILKRMRLDFLSYNVHCNVDIKTSRSTEWEIFRRNFETLGYHFQMENYNHGIEAITKKKPEHTALIAIDNAFPYEVEVYEMDEEYSMVGRYEYEKASKLLLESISKLHFPRKNKEIIYTEMSPWMRQKYQLLGVI